MDKEFEGKVAFVTGGGTGIGRASAIALAARGATVTITGRTEKTLKETVEFIEGQGGKARYAIADVNDEAAIKAAVGVAAEDGQLDYAVNSAGIDGGNDSYALADYPMETVDAMIATNVRGLFLSMKYELPLMAAAGSGSVVNLSSGAGLVGIKGYSGYSTSKFAEIGMTKSAALDYADRKVRVNAVCPGLVSTPLVAEMANQNPQLHDALMADHPLARIASPEEIADSVIWLCSDKSSYVTGISLAVDGGYTAR